MSGLVYECPTPVTFNLDAQSRITKIESFIEWVYELSETGEIGDFLNANKESFYDNKTICDYHLWDYDTGNENIIPAGMKIGKALVRYFAPRYGDELVDKIRTEMSMMIQEDKVTGKLCVSVHPLDYLSSSENNHNWRSCHALDGEYCAGNLSYMCDGCTVVVYLKSDKEDTKLPRFPKDVPWNDKKWRCLFHFDFKRRFIWAGRQYPFTVNAAYDIVTQKLFEPLGFFCNKYKLSPYVDLTWNNTVIKGDVRINDFNTHLKESYLVYNQKVFPLRDFIRSHPENMAFNDLLSSSYYTPKFLNFGARELTFAAEPMLVGAAVPCINCGKHNISFSESMLCKECIISCEDIEMDEITYCSCCGARTFYDYDYSFAGEMYCPDCYEQHIKTCENCGDIFYLEDEDHCLCFRCNRAKRANTFSKWITSLPEIHF